MANTTKPSIATPETDRENAERERRKGREARERGEPRENCPWKGGLTAKWWLEGFDGDDQSPLTPLQTVEN